MAFDPYAYGQELAADIITRFGGMNLSPEDAQENADIILEFNKIAADMLSQETGIEVPAPNGETSMIPLDEKTIPQAQSLFAEGLYYAIVKCAEIGITTHVRFESPEDPSVQTELKKHLLQNLAMDVYNQAKQMVVSTYGQESTPGFEFTHEQQVQMMAQTGESALMYYINEYERQYGPIEIEEPTPELLARVEQMPLEERLPVPEMAQPQPALSAALPKPKGPNPHDKYGAVALLLTTLPADQRAKILRNFNPEEKELIAFYSYPQHLEQNLDVSSVQAHLQRFREMMKQGGHGLKSAAYRGIAQLSKTCPPEMLLSCVQDERPAVKQYLASHYGRERLAAMGSAAVIERCDSLPGSRHFSDLLPGRIEEILYRYLSKRLESHA